VDDARFGLLASMRSSAQGLGGRGVGMGDRQSTRL